MKAESVAQEECDVVVPRAKIAEYVRLAKGIGAKYGIRVEPAAMLATETSTPRCCVTPP